MNGYLTSFADPVVIGPAGPSINVRAFFYHVEKARNYIRQHAWCSARAQWVEAARYAPEIDVARCYAHAEICDALYEAYDRRMQGMIDEQIRKEWGVGDGI